MGRERPYAERQLIREDQAVVTGAPINIYWQGLLNAMQYNLNKALLVDLTVGFMFDLNIWKRNKNLQLNQLSRLGFLHLHHTWLTFILVAHSAMRIYKIYKEICMSTSFQCIFQCISSMAMFDPDLIRPDTQQSCSNAEPPGLEFLSFRSPEAFLSATVTVAILIFLFALMYCVGSPLYQFRMI